MKRLSQATLNQLPDSVAKPQYDRSAIQAGIVHIGVGAFHRGHQAFYTDAVLNKKSGDWGIIGASLRSANVSEQLMPQDCLYTLVEKNNGEQCERVIGSIQSIFVAADQPDALINALADEKIKIISLTITEKGYHFNTKINGLNVDNPDVQHDLRNYQSAPITAIGYLVAALAVRKQKQSAGVTLLSCDNLPHNGKVLQRVVRDFAKQVDASLALWIEQNVSFPSTMIDRIVPATTPADIDALANKLSLEDRAAIFTEPFCQWVIEDHFVRGRPQWELAGALMVDNVTPFEDAKLRLLNGSHSLIAYLGNLAGYDFVHQVVADADFYQLICRYMDEVIPGLEVPASFNVDEYRQQLLTRFSNSSLNHKTAQIAQDGSQKTPQRWFNSVNNARCTQLDAHALALAGWVLFLAGKRSNGQDHTVESYVVIDPLAAELQAAVNDNPNQAIENALRVIGLGAIIQSHPQFLRKANQFLQSLRNNGVKAVIAQFNATTPTEVKK
jgi:fructuronate reductase